MAHNRSGLLNRLVLALLGATALLAALVPSGVLAAQASSQRYMVVFKGGYALNGDYALGKGYALTAENETYALDTTYALGRSYALYALNRTYALLDQYALTDEYALADDYAGLRRVALRLRLLRDRPEDIVSPRDLPVLARSLGTTADALAAELDERMARIRATFDERFK